MGLRDRLKKRVAKAIGRDSQKREATQRAAPEPPPPGKRPRASYRTHSAAPEPIEATTLATDPVPVAESVIEPMLEQVPVEQVPVEQAPVEQAPVEQPRVEPVGAESVVAQPTPAAADEAPMEKRPIDVELTYTVRLFNKAEGLDTEIQVFDGEFILDAADRCAVDLPSSCRNGGCTVCAGRLMSGTVDMEEQYVLEEEHIQDGFVLLCCAVLTSDAVIETHQDEVIT